MEANPKPEQCVYCRSTDLVWDPVYGWAMCNACFKDQNPVKAAAGAKDTAGKPRYSLLPNKGCLAVIEARDYGAKKYGSDENWVNVSEKDWIEAALRHIYSHLDGEDKDSESGVRHLHHAACSLFLACSIKDKA